jgi:hypothetical protein
MIQLKIDGIDIWEKYPIKMMGNRGRKKNEELRDQRVAYLLKKSYINTMLWSLSGVATVAALMTALGAVHSKRTFDGHSGRDAKRAMKRMESCRETCPTINVK